MSVSIKVENGVIDCLRRNSGAMPILQLVPRFPDRWLISIFKFLSLTVDQRFRTLNLEEVFLRRIGGTPAVAPIESITREDAI